MKRNYLIIVFLSFQLLCFAQFTSTISGKIALADNSPLANVSVQLTGLSQQNTTTDINGNYSFTVNNGGTYNLIPVKEGYSFNPGFSLITSITSNKTQNFTATSEVLTVSGTVTIADSVMKQLTIIKIDESLENDTIYTDDNGFYTTEVPYNSTFQLSPIKQSYSFIPTNYFIQNIQKDSTLNFDASQITKTISGKVSFANNNRQQDVSIYFIGNLSDTITVNTSADGTYSFDGLYGAQYIISPYKEGYSFFPTFGKTFFLANDTIVNFEIDLESPEIISPANQSKNMYYKWLNLDWDHPLVGEISFDLEIKTDDQGYSKVSNIQNNYYSLNDLEKNKTYTWRVQAINVNDSSEWSIEQSFKTTEIDDDLLFYENDSTIVLGSKTPIILIHGWNLNGKPASPATYHWNDFIDEFNSDTTLRSSYKLYQVAYFSNLHSVDEIAELLKQKFENSEISNVRFILMGYSIGGLIARSFVNKTFYTGSQKDENIGSNLLQLFTFGTPHHGSPLMNGPARDAYLGGLYSDITKEYDKITFKAIKYNEQNRSDLLWDNYDMIFDDIEYPNEKNEWLTNINENNNYDSKTIVYAGKIIGETVQQGLVTEENKLNVGAYILQSGFGLESDGLVPLKSSRFENHNPKQIRFFDNYNHSEIVTGKSDGLWFNQLKSDLVEVAGLNILYPTSSEIVLKANSSIEVLWHAPDYISNVDILFSTDNGNSFTELANNVNASLEKAQVLLPDTNTVDAKIIVVETGSGYNTGNFVAGTYSISDNPFSIYSERINFTNPNLYSIFEKEQSVILQWEHEGIAKKAKLSYFDKKTDFTIVLDEDFELNTGSNSFEWTAPNGTSVTDSAQMIIEITDLETRYNDLTLYRFSSEYFVIQNIPSISILAPIENYSDSFGIKGEKMETDSIYNIRWKTKGEIHSIKISLCDANKEIIETIATVEQTPSFENTGQYAWQVPDLHGDEFYLLLEAGTSNNVIRTSAYNTYKFRINRKPQLVFPTANDTTVGLYPCIQFIPLSNQSSSNITILNNEKQYSLELSSNDNEICVPQQIENELESSVEYNLIYDVLFGDYRSYKEKLTFRTKEIKPSASTIIKPMQGNSSSLDSLFIVWNNSIGAIKYELELRRQSSIIWEKLDLTKQDTTALYLFSPLSSINDTIHIKLKAINIIDTTTTYSYYIKTSKFQNVAHYKILSDNWVQKGNNIIESTEAYNIYLKNEFATGSSNKDILVTDGKIVIDRENDSIISANGKLFFNGNEKGYLPVFEGSIKLDSFYIYPLSQKNSIDNQFVPNLDPDKMEITNWDMYDYKISINYNDYYKPNFSGINGGDNNDFEIKINQFKIDNFGHIAGEAENFDISVGPLRFYCENVSLSESSIGDLCLIANKTSLVMADNDFFNCSVPTGYGAEFGLKLNGDSIGFVGTNIHDYPIWGDNAAAFPDLGFMNTRVIAPFANFKYFESENNWGIEMEGALLFPWVLKPEKSFKGAFNSTKSIPYIEAKLNFMSAAPYIKLIQVKAMNLSTMSSGYGIGVKNVWELDGFSGMYKIESTADEKLKNMTLNATATILFGPSIYDFQALSAVGEANFYLQKQPILKEEFSISGTLKLLRFISLAHSEISLSSIQSDTYVDLLLKGKAELAFPSLNEKLVSGDINIGMLNYYHIDKEIITPGFDLSIKGKLSFKVEKGMVNYMGVKWPNKDTYIKQEALIGKIKTSKSKSDYGFAFNYSSSISYPISVDCKATWESPYIECNTKWKQKTLKIGYFQPLNGKPICGFTNFKLAEFDRNKARQLNSKNTGMKGIKSYKRSGYRDSITIHIDENENEFIDFTIQYTGSTKPIIILKNPNGGAYLSTQFLEANPDREGTDGFVLTLENLAGDWVVMVPNSADIENYSIQASVASTINELSFNKVEINNQQELEISCSIPDLENDSAQVLFYLAENDSIQGLRLNKSELNFNNGTLSQSFDITNTEAGDYTLYAIVEDGINIPQRFNYESTVNISYQGEVLAPTTFEIIKQTEEIIIKWDASKGSKSYIVEIGKSSGDYNQEFETNERKINIGNSQDSIYFIVKGKSNIGNLSAASKEQLIIINELELDTIAPPTPQLDQPILYLADNDDEAYAQFSWTGSDDIIAYNLYVRDTINKADYGIDIKEQSKVKYYSLTKGRTYAVSIEAYDAAENRSARSSELIFDFFSMDDTDGDGMVDELEIMYFGSIEVSDDKDEDIDGDEISNIDEMNQTTNPNNLDTDDDGVPDNLDLHPNSNEDKDEDAMADDWETYFQVFSPNEDADNDGLLNKNEFANRTNPTSSDTDSGGLNDGDEIRFELNPNNQADDIEANNRIISEISETISNHKGDSVILSWTTQNEDLLKGFDVYRRFNEYESWTKVNDSIIIRINSSLESGEYRFTDTRADSVNNISYIIEGISIGTKRQELAQITASFKDYTSIDKLISINENSLFKIRPNPFRDELILSFQQASLNSPIKLNVFDIMGRKVYTNTYQITNSGSQTVRINMSTKPNALYFISVTADNKIYLEKAWKKP